jgi:hypothetical protein
MAGMMARKNKRPGGTAVRNRRDRANAWLGAEIELIIREHQRLLQAAGAAAALFTALDIGTLPQEARDSLHRLGATLASLSDETLSDAMEQMLGQHGAERLPAH